jgi:hypothetical protein
MSEVSEPRWRKSSFSGGGSEDCVEVAPLAASGAIAIRDSKDPNGPGLSFNSAQWARFTNEIKDGFGG